MPIGNGHAPGIEIGRDATGEELGAVAAVGDDTGLGGSGTALVVGMGGADFFAAIVFVGFLAALRAAGRRPAAFFFAGAFFAGPFLPGAFFAGAFFAGTFATFFAGLRALFAAERRADFLALDLNALARLRATVLRARVLAAARFAPARLADFFPTDLFFAAMSSPPVSERS